MPNSQAAIRPPLKILLLQEDRARWEEIVTQLSDAGFDVTAEIVETQPAFEERLRCVSYHLAINSLQLASSVQFLDPQSRTVGLAAAEVSSKFQAITAACPLGIVSLDLEGNVKMWNQGAEQLRGCHRDSEAARIVRVT